MRSAKGVVFTFITARKARQPAQLAQTGHALTPACEDFVRISLMAHIPHNAIFWRIENIVQGHCEFHGTQVGTQVTAGLRHVVQYALAHISGQAGQVTALQFSKV
jgi:hypothetical protein